jgi:signal peptidase I
LVAVTLRLVFFSSFRVTDNNMLPNFINGDQIIVYRLPYTLANLSIDKGRWLRHSIPKRGQSVIFQNADLQANPVLARVIGLPGDRVDFNQGELILNGVAFNQMQEKESSGASDSQKRFVVKKIGHNLLDKSWNILSTPQKIWADAKQEYVVTQGHILVMRDNWNTLDDKLLFFEVKLEQILGRVQLIWFSLPSDEENFWAAARWERTFRLVD